MQNSFYATDDDEKAVWRMALAIPGMQIFERWTHESRELRQFATSEEIYEARATQAHHLQVCLFPSTAGGLPTVECELTETGELWSQTLRGPTTIGFLRYPPVSGCMNYCNFSAWNETGARDRSIYSDEWLDGVDWKIFRSIFRKLRRDMEKAAPAKLGSTLILKDAFGKLKSGEIKLWAGEEISISSQGLMIKGAKLH